MKEMYRKAKIYLCDAEVGILQEAPEGFVFAYNEYAIENKKFISQSLPLQKEPFKRKELFSFFEGLIPEGWYLDVVCKTKKIDKADLFSLLLQTGKDTVGAVKIEEVKE